MTRRRWLMLGLLTTVLAAVVTWFSHDPWPARALIHPQGGWVALGFAADGRALLIRPRLGAPFEAWDLATGRRRPAEGGAAVVPRAFAPDRRSFAGVVERPGGGREVAWVDAATGTIRARFDAGGGLFRYPAFAADGRSLRAFVGDRPDRMEVVAWDLETGAEERRPAAFVRSGGLPLAAAPDGAALAFAAPGGRVVVGDATTGRAVGRSLGSPALRPDPNVAPIFTPDGRSLVIAGRDGRVEVWGVAAGRLERAINLPFRGMTMLALNLSADGRTLAASAAESAPDAADWLLGLARWSEATAPRPIRTDLVLVDLATGRTLARARGSSYAEFTPDGRTVVTAAADGTFAVRDAPVLPAR